ncbi:MAG: class I SAM-dependent methyltransferase [Halobacteriales archaeon]
MSDPEESYTGEHARLYDALTATGDREDVSFYLERAREAEGPVLELACGTGRIYLDLLEAGVDVDGFDHSADALGVLRERAADRGVEPAVWQGDMAEFSVDRAYDLAICPFNALQHLRTVDDQLSALRSVHDALGPGGRFVFDVFVPGFDVICESYGEWEARTVAYRGEPHEVRSRSRIVDEVEQQFAVEVEGYGPGGEQVFAVEHRLKMLPKREVELLARLSPFEDWTVTGDFGEEPIEDGDSVQVWTLRKV